MRQLAQQFMDYAMPESSCCPPRPTRYTLAEEEGGDDHYADLSQTLGFLMKTRLRRRSGMGLLSVTGVASPGGRERGGAPGALREQIRERL